MGGLILRELKRTGTLNSWRAQKTPARMRPEKGFKKFQKLKEIKNRPAAPVHFFTKHTVLHTSSHLFAIFTTSPDQGPWSDP